VICQRCGAYVDNASLVCAKCGSLLSRKKGPVPGVDNLRQGKAAPEAPKDILRDLPPDTKIYGEEDDFGVPMAMPGKRREALKTGRSRHNRKLRSYERDAGRPHTKRGVPAMTDSVKLQPLLRREKTANPISKRSMNWAKMLLAAVLVVLAAMLGVYFYLNNTMNGQVVMARRDKAKDSLAYWTVGEEYLNQGYISRAIETFEKARGMDSEKDPRVDNIDGLLLLGAAYEADARLEDAQALYTNLYEKIVPSRPEPYRNVIRLLMEKDMDREAGELMQMAFEKTGVLNFRQQRTDLLPKNPETSLPAGRYSERRFIEFTSPQGYDVYYTLKPEEDKKEEDKNTGEEPAKEQEEAEEEKILSDDWILYTEPITLEEGVYNYRVVAVSGRLVSDPLAAGYTMYLPSPPSPKSRLQSGTYNKRRTIYIYPSDGDKTCEMYYTMDGSEPNPEDSPSYTEAGIIPPSGNVKLKMIAVNELGKVSNASEVSYKFDVKPYQLSVYDSKDLFTGFELLKTTLADFEAAHGKGGEETQEVLLGFDEPCRRIPYEWGSILVGRDRMKRNWVLIEVDMDRELFAPPRGIHFGDASQSIMDLFRDSTQPAGKSGNRGLYYSDAGVGRYYNLGNGEGMLRYTCKHPDGNTMAIEFYFTGDKVTRIKHWYAFS